MTNDSKPHQAPVRLQSAAGLAVQVNANGSIHRMDHRDVIINLFLGSEIEGGPANLWLRRHGESIESIPLLGPRSPASVHLDERGFAMRGEWDGIRFEVSLVLAQSMPAWFWHVRLENAGPAELRVDLVHAQDLALAHYGAVRNNEYYVSQYVDYSPLAHAERGTVLAVRQNLAVGTRHPWAMFGSLRRAASFTTDALGLHGLATRANAVPTGLASATLPGRRQHEHSMAVIADEPVSLAPGEAMRAGFFAALVEDHPEVSSEADLALVDRILSLPEAGAEQGDAAPASGRAPVPSCFVASPPLESLDPSDAELTAWFGAERRHAEREGAALLSFFAATHGHVVTRAKELRVLRPHGHIMRTGEQLVPDEASLTTTCWMSGVFHSFITQGHVNINRMLSTVHSYLGLQRAAGLRVFVEQEGGWRLLDLPSAFETTPSSCRWIYRHAGGLISVRSRAATQRHELDLALEVLEGAALSPARREPCRAGRRRRHRAAAAASGARWRGHRASLPARYRCRPPLSRGLVPHRSRPGHDAGARGRRRAAVRRRPLAQPALARDGDRAHDPGRLADHGWAGGNGRSRRKLAPTARKPSGRRWPAARHCRRRRAARTRRMCHACRTSCPGSRTTRSSTTSRRAGWSSTAEAAGARAT